MRTPFYEPLYSLVERFLVGLHFDYILIWLINQNPQQDLTIGSI